MGKATVVRVDGSVEELGGRPSLEESQLIVGGYIELIKAFDRWGNKVVLVVDEEGKLKGKLLNRSIDLTYGNSVPGGPIVGDVIILEGWRTVG